MAHDFKKFPELNNGQFAMYYFDSPHQQIMESFDARVVKVVDGDTIRVMTSFRDFDFPIRMSNLMAAEMSEEGGERSRQKLADLILNENVEIIINKKNRVGKYGRLLGQVKHRGFDVGEEMKSSGFAVDVWKEQLGIKELLLIL